MKNRVVITGMGVVSPLGNTIDEFWEKLLGGESGVDRISLFDASSFPCQIAGEVKDDSYKKLLTRTMQKFHSRSSHFACAAYSMAMADASLVIKDPYRIDAILGISIPPLGLIDDEIDKSSSHLTEYEPRKFDPAFPIKFFLNAPASAIGLIAGVKGYITTVSSACASGLTAAGISYQRIRDGYADIAITGSVDTPVNRIILNTFCESNLLSTNNADPKHSAAPFDENRTKPVLAEGCGIFIFESVDHALARNAKIYAEVVSFHQDHENINEIFAMDKSGDAWRENIAKTINNSKNISLINAHAPSDRHLDKLECEVLQRVLGDQAHSTPTISIKGALGSAFSAAGAFQMISSALSIYHNTIPPSCNYFHPDPDCNMPIVNKAKHKVLEQILVNSHALGGTNASLLLKKFRI